MNIANDLVVLDLETTGTWVEKDKIIEIAMIKCTVDGRTESYSKRVNPGMTIPKIVEDLTGIRNMDVQNEPSFVKISREVLEFIGDADLAGFNIERFDLPLLEREMVEAGLRFEWQSHTIYDAQKIYHLNEKRDLTAAYEFYCDKELKNAHSALADTEATLEILKAQITRYGDGDTSLVSLKEFDYRTTADYYDSSRRFRWWNGKLYPMFGKYAKRYSLQEMVSKDPKYCQWVTNADFNDDVKELVKKALAGVFPDPPQQDILQES